MTRRQYTEAQKAEAVGLALTIGARQAAIRLGMPHRNVARWATLPEYRAMVVETERDVAARLWKAISDGTTQVAEGLRDPKARLGEKAQALRVLMETHQLLTGAATARTEAMNLNVNEDRRSAGMDSNALGQLHDFLDAIDGATDDELRLYLATNGKQLLAAGGVEPGDESGGTAYQLKRAVASEQERVLWTERATVKSSPEPSDG